MSEIVDSRRNSQYDDSNMLPVVKGGERLFTSRPKAVYYVGVMAAGDYLTPDGSVVPGDIFMPAAFDAARQLRFRKYNSLGWLPDSAQDEDGGEHDEDDARSIQIGVIKNGQGRDGARLIATSRLIVRDESGPLPIEKYFPEAFVDGVQVPQTETSRMVSASLDKRERAMATLACHRAMLGCGVSSGYGNTSAVAEDWLLRRFEKIGLPYERIGDFKEIDDYGDSRNAPILIDAQEIVDRTCFVKGKAPLSTKLLFNGALRNGGLGYYDRYFMRRFK